MLRERVSDCSQCELHHPGGCVFAPRKLKADEVLTAQGAVATEVGFVRSGIVSLSATSTAGAQTWGAMRGPHSLLGLEALEGARSACEVRALTDVELCVATVPSVKFMLGAPDGARTLFGLTLTEVLEQRRDIEFRTGTAEARVARFALACERFIGKGKTQPLSKARVAALVGIRPETLSRVLTSGIKVVKREALETLAETAG
jgi:CRP-like cAMP-binding protein